MFDLQAAGYKQEAGNRSRKSFGENGHFEMKNVHRLICVLLLLLAVSGAYAENESDIIQIAVSYCTVDCDSRPIIAEYADQWLLSEPEQYNHKLMQASFVMAASAFRDKTRDLDQMDFNIRSFFSRAGFNEPQTDDYDRLTSISTIGSAIAHKKVGSTTLIAAAISGNNYQNEWLSNFTVSDEARVKGFNDASAKVLERIKEYIRDHSLTGPLRLWITGYSRAAAVANITAADATECGLFEAVYGYTVGTPRTTKDQDAGRFGNIFNVINPFDPVPLMPFPEWGYSRYGMDLYLPSMETDSKFFEKKQAADDISIKITGNAIRFNPMVNAQIHTIMDYLSFFVNSSGSYNQYVQDRIIYLWETHDYKTLWKNIREQIGTIDSIATYRLKEYYYFLDFLCQTAYTSFRGQKFHPDNYYWNPGLSLQENLMHEHYDSAYLAWIFSSDDPERIYTDVPKYIHYTVLGDVDVELFDSQNNFIERIDRRGHISEDPETAESTFTGGKSTTHIYADRSDDQTFIVLPEDQTFSAVIYSRKDQSVHFSLVEYAANRTQANVRYIYQKDLKKNESAEGFLDLFYMQDISETDLVANGFLVEEPWSKDTVYSPTAVMKLENNNIFHPEPLSFLTFGCLLVIFAAYILIVTTSITVSGVKTGIKKLRANKTVQKKEPAAHLSAKIEKNEPKDQNAAKDEHHENQ